MRNRGERVEMNAELRRHEVVEAMYWVWVVLSILVLLAQALSLSEMGLQIGDHLPPCSARLQGTRCPLCGMTRAFYLLARGEMKEAAGLNRGALPLFALFALNSGLFVGHLAAKCSFTFVQRIHGRASINPERKEVGP